MEYQFENTVHRLKLNFDLKEMKYSADERVKHQLQEEELNIKELNKQLQPFKVNVTYQILNIFMSQLQIQMSDSSVRELGFNAEFNRFYKTQKGEWNRMAEFSLLLYANLMPTIFKTLVHALQQKCERTLSCEVFGCTRQSQLKKCKVQMSFNQLPMVIEQLSDEQDLAAVLSFC